MVLLHELFERCLGEHVRACERARVPRRRREHACAKCACSRACAGTLAKTSTSLHASAGCKIAASQMRSNASVAISVPSCAARQVAERLPPQKNETSPKVSPR